MRVPSGSRSSAQPPMPVQNVFIKWCLRHLRRTHKLRFGPHPRPRQDMVEVGSGPPRCLSWVRNDRTGHASARTPPVRRWADSAARAWRWAGARIALDRRPVAHPLLAGRTSGSTPRPSSSAGRGGSLLGHSGRFVGAGWLFSGRPSSAVWVASSMAVWSAITRIASWDFGS